jgi:hypothetical protein
MEGAAGRVDHRTQAEPAIDQVPEEPPLLIMGEIVGLDDEEAPRDHRALRARNDPRMETTGANPGSSQDSGSEPIGRAPEMAGVAPLAGIPFVPYPNDVPGSEELQQGHRLGNGTRRN